MDGNEQQVIDGLFDRVREAEQGSGPRDAAAERRIAEHVGRQPAAPYYMAQAMLVQEQALQSAQQKIQALEQQAQQRPAGGGGFLSGLFGGGGNATASQGGPWNQGRQAGRPGPTPQMQQMAQYQRQGGGGFLAGAMQTAVGVAGGLVVGNMLMDAFSGGGEELAAGAEGMVDGAVEPVADMAPAEDFGGDMGGFDEEI